MNAVTSLLQSLVFLVGTPTVTVENVSLDWNHSSEWKREGEVLTFQAESTAIVEVCREAPSSYVVTPISLQAAQAIYLDGKLIAVAGDINLRNAFRMYSSLVVPCEKITAGKALEWKVLTATSTLAHIQSLPEIKASIPFFQTMGSIMPALVAAALLAIGLIGFILFYGKISKSLLYSLLIGSFSFGICFGGWVPDLFLIEIDALHLVKTTDLFLMVGTGCMFYIFEQLNYTFKYAYRCIAVAVAISIALTLAAGSLDQIQVGDSILFITSMVFIFSVLIKATQKTLTGTNTRKTSLKFLAALVYAFTAMNDILLFQGTLDTISIYPFGVLAMVVLLTLSVNENIVEAYRERDYLRGNLEKEVQIKTSELQTALVNLKSAQAEIVQSAKLASLGTLAAGIAHEINNALNFVNGSLKPLQTTLAKEQLSEEGKGRITKLTDLMKEGLDLTFGIISNLKRHAGTGNHTHDREALDLKEAVEGVLLLLKGKTPSELELKIDIGKGLEVLSNSVSLSQILINLILNSIQALEEEKAANKSFKMQITFVGQLSNTGMVTLEIQDNGPGIPTEIQDRIFDPFFTTKAVGKGTGLGLHIARSEMQKHGGKISLKSPPGSGVTFVLEFPHPGQARSAA